MKAAHTQAATLRHVEPLISKRIQARYVKSSTLWQPSDLLPPLDNLKELQLKCKELPREVLVTLVGDMITEEALPTYTMTLNTLSGGVSDKSGEDDTTWAKWLRTWSAEENRHGDVLKTFLYMSGRLDMGGVEKSIHKVIQSGFSNGMLDDPYKAFIYTSFQERATKVAHLNTIKFSKKYGVDELSVMCYKIAQDEGTHEVVYTDIIALCLPFDPDGVMRALRFMMEKGIRMPAINMDGFNEYSTIAEKLGVYGISDYIDIYDHLMDRWDVKNVKCVTEDGKKDQDFLVNGLRRKLERMRGLREKMLSKSKVGDVAQFDHWFL